MTPRSVLSKTKWAKSWQMSLLSAPGNVLITTRGVVVHPDRVLVKQQVLTTVAGRRRDAQTIKVPGAYTLLR